MIRPEPADRNGRTPTRLRGRRAAGVGNSSREQSPMTSITTLLVTSDPSVLNTVQQLHDELEYARLEVCGRLEKVPSRLGRDHCLLLVHCGADADPERVRTVLTAADRSLVKAAVVRCATA